MLLKRPMGLWLIVWKSSAEMIFSTSNIAPLLSRTLPTQKLLSVYWPLSVFLICGRHTPILLSVMRRLFCHGCYLTPLK